MLAKFHKDEFESIVELLEGIESGWINSSKFAIGVKKVMEEIGKDLRKKGIEIDTENLRKFLEKLKETEAKFTTEEEEKYFKIMLKEVKDGYYLTETLENGNIRIFTIIPEDFYPDAFKDVAFLYWLRREDAEETHGELTDKQWKEFKELYEETDLPDSTFEAIKDFEYEIVDQTKEVEGK